jgi:hypothetical protein
VPPPTDDTRWSALCAELDLHPATDSTAVTAAARSMRGIAPEVPAGWQYQPANDGVGVLAPAHSFARGTVGLDDW